MRVDKDDRYISEQPNKDSMLPLKWPDFLQNYPKKKLIICGLIILIIFLLLSLIIFRPSQTSEPTPLTPPVVNGVASTDETDTTNAIHNGQSNVTDNGKTPDNALANSERSTPSKPDVPKPSENSSNSINSTDNPNVASNANRNGEKKPTKNTANLNDDNNSLAKNFRIRDDHYVIQITASRSAEGLKKFVTQNKITDYQIYETQYSNGKWFILVKGNYSSLDEARKAIKSLPAALQKDKPWVKSGAEVNKEKIVN
ncbi:SPOR domain-containing protein [Gilliamella sp. B14448G11]|uniref:SPOR domain-containing protein n=1 Tax=unclassified Gilliamella TaxID=2685620 RepID=UPI0018DCD24B|nr:MULTISPECIES: SPOR domain-containing protein [unclassified Gilliamella]MBI0027550.1 SPOR domain-containing protein [Gilliamella sp. B14448G7]MBI0029990.1 SPOR domain-containing protein [Gilliamella sp. B14384G15]MBI0034958.1 SPOR domain-containing protein [Gilliamella sp. B14448G11]MBI0041374.1 SPOR domain-containing protein [Gilliamella sp. B14448G12]MBI0057146.1 SPOR domain-containing protein [Gilliamella sp. B14384G12]